MQIHLRLVALALVVLGGARAYGFCGFYVAKADAQLFNKASQVALVRDGERTVLTMSNDYQGELKDFALVVPLPAVVSKDQIHVTERKYIERLDAFSGPRLVEYHDPSPCMQRRMEAYDMARAPSAGGMAQKAEAKRESAKALGVTIEAEYTVGEYDIVLLSAKQSEGLVKWLLSEGYKIPAKSEKALTPYIRQDMKFFVAKVNLKEQMKTGYQYLRPLQIAYESKKFMLPIRLGMANAQGPQDLVIYVMTKQGRVESVNYRTANIPSDVEVPSFVRRDFGEFYKAMFERKHEQENGKALLTEYFWDMGWCDPCAADPLSRDELAELGVFWLDEGTGQNEGFVPPIRGGSRVPRMPRGGGAVPVKLTRLHVRYDESHFPEDLVFQETTDTRNFQGRYVMRNAWKGSLNECPEAKQYFRSVRDRNEREVQTLASLTGWDASDLRRKLDPLPDDDGPVYRNDDPGRTPPTRPDIPEQKRSWWNKLWK